MARRIGYRAVDRPHDGHGCKRKMLARVAVDDMPHKIGVGMCGRCFGRNRTAQRRSKQQ